jgi:hypothetical protein
MDTFNILASVSSIVGMLFSALAAMQARSASKAALAARDAALVRSLADELQVACSCGEQLVDFLQYCRYSEACLRVDQLTWSLSELPHRRSPQLSTQHKNALLTSRQQLQTISEAIAKHGSKKDTIDQEQIMIVARRVTMCLREVLGDIRSHIEHGEA